MKNGEVDGMPLWQNHEQRITSIEVNMSNLKGEFTEVKEMIEKGNDKQVEKLEAIDTRLMDEFFTKKKASHDTKMKIYLKAVGGLVGGGGVLYALYDIVFKSIGG